MTLTAPTKGETLGQFPVVESGRDDHDVVLQVYQLNVLRHSPAPHLEQQRVIVGAELQSRCDGTDIPSTVSADGEGLLIGTDNGPLARFLHGVDVISCGVRHSTPWSARADCSRNLIGDDRGQYIGAGAVTHFRTTAFECSAETI